MALRLYNTLGRKKQVFKPIKDKEVRMYGCGPTVYWYQHIGNLRRYVFEDVLKRTLLFNGYSVKHIINITDVGHLTSDADEGEDKMMKAIKREGLSLTPASMLKIADKYASAFFEDLNKMNVIKPDMWAKATEHVKEMIELIKKIEKNGYTYKTKVGLIFDTVKFKDYAKFAKLSVDELKKGARVEPDPERRNSSDFALWITNQPNSVMQWDSPWGRGFPGWHIECSAMSSKYFGEQFDIHTGGEEHIPIHHTNEIAQSEAAFGKKPWVKYWLHMRWLLFKGEKMSKSTGGIYRLSQLEEEGYKPLALRYLFLTAQYRTQLDFTMEALQNAQNSYLRLKNIAATLEDDGKTNKKYVAQFEKAVNDDLNTPEALAVLWNFIRDPKATGKLNTLAKMDEVLGLDLLKKEKSEISEHVKILIEQREEARKKKDFKTADRIRNELKEKGVILEDQPDGGTRWKVIK